MAASFRPLWAKSSLRKPKLKEEEAPVRLLHLPAVQAALPRFLTELLPVCRHIHSPPFLPLLLSPSLAPSLGSLCSLCMCVYVEARVERLVPLLFETGRLTGPELQQDLVTGQQSPGSTCQQLPAPASAGITSVYHQIWHYIFLLKIQCLWRQDNN